MVKLLMVKLMMMKLLAVGSDDLSRRVSLLQPREHVLRDAWNRVDKFFAWHLRGVAPQPMSNVDMSNVQ
jgi:hypothetical protein